jgi:hypothetical protein
MSEGGTREAQEEHEHRRSEAAAPFRTDNIEARAGSIRSDPDLQSIVPDFLQDEISARAGQNDARRAN